jgi:hypothetical protein
VRVSLSKDRIDFGVTPPGKKLHAEIFVKNDGRDSITISRIKSSCGCTVGVMDNPTVPPKHSALLDIEVKAPLFHKELEESIVLFVNGVDSNPTKIVLRASVQTKLDILPQGIDFGVLDHPSVPMRRHVQALFPAEIETEGAYSWQALVEGNNSVSATVMRNTEKKGVLDVSVVLTPPVVSGALSGEVRVVGTGPNNENVRQTVPIAGKCIGAIGALPDAVIWDMNLPPSDEAKGYSAKIKLLRRGSMQLGVKIDASLKHMVDATLDQDDLLLTVNARGRQLYSEVAIVKVAGMVLLLDSNGAPVLQIPVTLIR